MKNLGYRISLDDRHLPEFQPVTILYYLLLATLNTIVVEITNVQPSFIIKGQSFLTLNFSGKVSRQ